MSYYAPDRERREFEASLTHVFPVTRPDGVGVAVNYDPRRTPAPSHADVAFGRLAGQLLDVAGEPKILDPRLGAGAFMASAILNSQTGNSLMVDGCDADHHTVETARFNITAAMQRRGGGMTSVLEEEGWQALVTPRRQFLNQDVIHFNPPGDYDSLSYSTHPYGRVLQSLYGCLREGGLAIVRLPDSESWELNGAIEATQQEAFHAYGLRFARVQAHVPDERPSEWDGMDTKHIPYTSANALVVSQELPDIIAETALEHVVPDNYTTMYRDNEYRILAIPDNRANALVTL